MVCMHQTFSDHLSPTTPTSSAPLHTNSDIHLYTCTTHIKSDHFWTAPCSSMQLQRKLTHFGTRRLYLYYICLMFSSLAMMGNCNSSQPCCFHCLAYTIYSWTCVE